MKNLYTLLFLATLNFTFAQDPLLFNTTWYLSYLNSNGVTYIPSNSNITLNFTSATTFSTVACNTLMGTVNFADDYFNFSATNYNISLEICQDAAAASFQNTYFPFFGWENGTSPTTPQNYTCSVIYLGFTPTLFINSEFNEEAVYGIDPLSTQQFNKESFSIYPNPSADFIEIKLNNSPSKNTTLDIYNNTGILQKSEHLTDSTTQINISNLATGIYFLKITSETGTSVKKLIKK